MAPIEYKKLGHLVVWKQTNRKTGNAGLGLAVANLLGKKHPKHYTKTNTNKIFD